MIRTDYRDKDTGEVLITRNVVDGETTVNEIAQVTNKTVRELCEFLQRVVDSGGTLPERRHGKWLDGDDSWTLVCSECYVEVDKENAIHGDGELNYCPNCGARMDEVDKP